MTTEIQMVPAIYRNSWSPMSLQTHDQAVSALLRGYRVVIGKKDVPASPEAIRDLIEKGGVK